MFPQPQIVVIVLRCFTMQGYSTQELQAQQLAGLDVYGWAICSRGPTVSNDNTGCFMLQTVVLLWLLSKYQLSKQSEESLENRSVWLWTEGGLSSRQRSHAASTSPHVVCRLLLVGHAHRDMHNI